MRTNIFVTVSVIVLLASSALAQKVTFTGSVLIYGTGANTRTTTSTFTLNINGRTSDAEAQRLLGVLQQGDQDDLRKALGNSDLGRFSIGGRVGIPIEAVVVDKVDGKTRIRAIAERWQGFGELWRGGRSLDYPFSYIEILIDPRSGSGDGTFIAAAKIRWRNNNGQKEVEIEDFGTFPGRLMGVRMRGTVQF